MLQSLLSALVITPIIGLIGCLLLSKKWERSIFTVAIATLLAEAGLLTVLLYQWLSHGAAPIETSLATLYSSDHYTLSIVLLFDTLSAVFISTTLIITTLIFIFSKFYMHRDQGFKRFYDTVLLFFIGLTFIIFAGNFEVLFFGWEIIGISSVLLIAFYRDRYLPSRNALKVFTLYRIADMFLLMALLVAHHTFKGNVHFSEASQFISGHGSELTLLGFLLVITAIIKSAQFPFSYWLPRAMEGPTTSSAIFYGALSVHMGLFLLFRTYPFWENSDWVRIFIAISGLVTALVATSIARVQSSAKTQIAYASIAQIGIMFIELAAGLHWLVLIHFVSNACLRAYQLLISPSMVSYLVHDQFFNFEKPIHKINNTFSGRVRATLFVLGVKEWGMNTAMSHYVWLPLKFVGRLLAIFDNSRTQVAALILFLLATFYTANSLMSDRLIMATSTIAAFVSIACYIRAYTTKSSAVTGWNLIMLGHLFGVLFLAVASQGDWFYAVMYGVGVAVAYILGHACIAYLQSKSEHVTLGQYQGLVYKNISLSYVFLFTCLLYMAFPISPSFLAQDILLSLVQEHHPWQVILFCAMYLLAGVSIMRLYIKLFFGSHITNNDEKAFRSS
jgi:NADH-quinone oxidoreductase subunit L